MSSTGYLYCSSNPSKQGVLKVSMDKPTGENKIEIKMKVSEPEKKLNALHSILSKYEKVVDDESFVVSVAVVETFFGLFD